MTLDKLSALRVVKGGGDVNKDAESVRSFAKFISRDSRRRAIVTSAPGKRDTDKYKLTQFLFKEVATASRAQQRNLVKVVRQRFLDITEPLSIDSKILDPSFEHLRKVLEVFRPDVPNHVDELKAFGERCQQYVLAEAIKKFGVDVVVIPPERYAIIEKDMGVMRFSEASYRFIRNEFAKAGDATIVTAGFYGLDKFDNLRTLPFGGTDVSAAHIARALNADLYENVKTVDGYANIDPSLPKDNKNWEFMKKNIIHYDYVLFDEAVEASNGGAKVIHHDALEPCRGNGDRKEIPIRVMNLNKSDDIGTIITDHEISKYDNPNKFITKQDNFVLVTIEHDKMMSASAYLSRIHERLGARSIPYNYISASNNTLTFAVCKDNINGNQLNAYKRDIESEFPRAGVHIQDGISIIAIVNKVYYDDGVMRTIPGLLDKASAPLAFQGISKDFISQSVERAIFFGVESKHADRAVLAIANEYYGTEQIFPDLPLL